MQVVEGGEALKTKAAIERTKFDSHISGIVENSQSALKVNDCFFLTVISLNIFLFYCYFIKYFLLIVANT